MIYLGHSRAVWGLSLESTKRARHRRSQGNIQCSDLSGRCATKASNSAKRSLTSSSVGAENLEKVLKTWQQDAKRVRSTQNTTKTKRSNSGLVEPRTRSHMIAVQFWKLLCRNVNPQIDSKPVPVMSKERQCCHVMCVLEGFQLGVACSGQGISQRSQELLLGFQTPKNMKHTISHISRTGTIGNSQELAQVI